MGKSVRTSPMSYTSLYLRRSRTGRGFQPPDRASSRGDPRRIRSRPTVVPIPARTKSKSRPLASGILSNTIRHHPTSMPRRERCYFSHIVPSSNTWGPRRLLTLRVAIDLEQVGALFGQPRVELVVPAAAERACNVEPLTPMSSEVAIQGHPLVHVTLGLLVLIRQGQKTGRVFRQYPLEVVDSVLRLGSSL